MSLYDKIPSNIEKGRNWLETELSCAEALYTKLRSQIKEDDELYLPSPFEFLQDAEPFTELWYNYKDTLLDNYKTKHAASLAEKKRIQTDKVDYWTRTEEENIAHALKVEEEYANGTRTVYVFPPDFETDTNALNEYLNSELCSYYGMIVELNRILIKDFPELVVEAGESFDEDQLTPNLETFGKFTETHTEIGTIPGTEQREVKIL